MSWIRGTLVGVWEFVVGDDWVTAVGVVIALALTALVSAWWVMAAAVPILLALSLWRAGARR